MKSLIVFFSCSGVTKNVAHKIANVINGDLYQIQPLTPYSEDDLNWNDNNSRSSLEMKDMTSRPAIVKDLKNLEQYDSIFVGFPIWWYVAPTIINTFLESYDFDGKKVIPFATSGGSGVGDTDVYLQKSCQGNVKLYQTTMLNGNLTDTRINQWIKGLKL